jgi:pyruvate dehydrogenase (quinone)
VGDAKATLKELIPLLERKEDRSWRDEIEANVRDWWEIVEEVSMQDADPMNPQRVVWELNAHLPEDAILCADSGSSTNWFARQLKVKKGNLASLSGTLATMGDGVPYAIAAKFAFPQRPVIAFVGDGAFQMNGMNELLTVKKYWEENWKEHPTLVFCVFNNQDLNQVTWEQRVLSGDPRFAGSQQIPDFPAARYAELIGLAGIRCDDGDKLSGAWHEALNAGRPCVLEVVVDRNVPPLPPHIKLDMAKKMGMALIGGDDDAGGIMEKSLKGKLAELKQKLPS